MSMQPLPLLTGHDTIECAYYLKPVGEGCLLDYESLEVQKEELRRAKSKKPKPIQLGCEEFMLASHGTGSGYPFLIENDAFSIQFGEFNKPNFFITYRSVALWHQGAAKLHKRFLDWAASVGMVPYRPESLSRVDFTFDYQLSEIDFDEDNFISQANKDAQHRKNGRIQTFRFGSDAVVLRIYNKCDEIEETSHKTWFYDLWGVDKDVWRIEWQTRKQVMRLVGIRTFESLLDRQGDLLRLLVKEHTTLCIKTADSNRSRWPLHPLWQDLTEQVNKMEGLGVVRELDMAALLDERLARISVSMYGYMKRIAAIDCMQTGEQKAYVDETFDRLRSMIDEIHDPLTWQTDVQRRITEMRLGEW
jgi:hypothetical protein